MDYELARNVPFIWASLASAIATWLTLHLARFCLVVVGIEFAPWLGDWLVVGVSLVSGCGL
jgi:hypothetical protein